MTVFLTSSPTGSLDGEYQVEGFDESNGFRENLSKVWPDDARCLMIASDPDDFDGNDEMTDFFGYTAEVSGLGISRFDILDHRDTVYTKEDIQGYDVIFLAGGHVPTQNDFFKELELKRKLQGFDGVIIGISAGSMNSAEIVYAEPELDGETEDPDYRRFITGLGLTRKMLIPHYQMTKNNYLDGKRLFKDIVYPDSHGREFFAIPDGSYLMIDENGERFYGEHHLIADGKIFRRI
ncbi:MAG: Type 1 glutamine amidotransferase-like domain-containing protein [Eubacteriales bacterium]|nr:Type 1 glutamine amidotransferase-like domain-containing protein [Eubacteriales bacterium]